LANVHTINYQAILGEPASGLSVTFDVHLLNSFLNPATSLEKELSLAQEAKSTPKKVNDIND
tara:strand:- start:354 stop:539 length:186 start_codon:yes stop_codon:yes gene_type:complete